MFIDTMDKFAELHGKVNRKNFGLTLDIGHLVCMGETPVGGTFAAGRIGCGTFTLRT